MSPTPVAIVGAGKIARDWHLPVMAADTCFAFAVLEITYLPLK
jgi:predicted dehydrogenase